MKTVRQHARDRGELGELGGADAQALEHAVTITERERDSALRTVSNLQDQVKDLQRRVKELEAKAPLDGWALTKKVASDKYHLYKAGKSLCFRFKFKGPYTPQREGEAISSLDCKTCVNKALALTKKGGPYGHV